MERSRKSRALGSVAYGLFYIQSRSAFHEGSSHFFPSTHPCKPVTL